MGESERLKGGTPQAGWSRTTRRLVCGALGRAGRRRSDHGALQGGRERRGA